MSADAIKDRMEDLCYSRTPLRALLGYSGPFFLVLVWVGSRGGISPGRAMGLLFSGVLYWTLIEYVLHRWAFHWQSQAKLVKIFVELSHMRHHHQPNDLKRLVAGPLFALPLGALVYGLTWLIVRSTELACFLMAGVLIGHLVYEWVHYEAHAGRSKGRLISWLRRYHLGHHFRSWNASYGVTSPVWDFLLGTTPGKNAPKEHRTRLAQSWDGP